MNEKLQQAMAAHPSIVVGDGVLGNSPHIKGRRLSVRTVLARIYTLGSIEAVAEAYELSEEQVKEAIAFTQDLIEAVAQLVNDE